MKAPKHWRIWVIISAFVLLVTLLLALPLYFEAAMRGWIPSKGFSARAKVSYSRAIFREYSGKLHERFPDADSYPGRPYWGPLSEELYGHTGLSPSEMIDPFNLDGPRRSWRKGGIISADRGPSVRLKGGDFHFYSDGEQFWLLISRGPDEKLDLDKEKLDSIAKLPSDERIKVLEGYSYSPVNGSISGGDVWRANGY